MLTRILVVNDGSVEDPSYTANDQDGLYLYDSESLDEIVAKARKYQEDHPDLDEIVIEL